MKLALLAISFAIASSASAAEEARIVEMLGSEADAAIVRNAERIEACLLIIDWEASAKIATKIISSEGACIRLSESDASLLKAKLLASSSYIWDAEEKECMPDFHVRLRAHQGGRVVEVDFCFGCDILQFHRGSEVIVQKNFDPVSSELFAVFRRLFPDDPTMRSLKERREAWTKQRKEKVNQVPMPGGVAHR